MDDDQSQVEALSHSERMLERIAAAIGVPVGAFYERATSPTLLTTLAAAIRVDPPGLAALIEAYVRIGDLAERERCVALASYLADQSTC